MVRRHVRSEFVPDVFVFPGGSVQAADREAEQAPGVCLPTGDGPTTLGTGFRAAAIRELFEEAGALVALREGASLTVAPDDLPRLSAAPRRPEREGGDPAGGRPARRPHAGHRHAAALGALDHPGSLAQALRHAFLPRGGAGGTGASPRRPGGDAERMGHARGGAGGLRARRVPTGLRHHPPTPRPESAWPTWPAARARFAGQIPQTIMPRVDRRDGQDVILLPWE